MKKQKTIVVAFLLFCLQISSNGVFAQDTLVLSTQNNLYSLDSTVYFFEDVNRNLTINQIQKTQFSPLPDNKLNFGYSYSAYWFKINLKNTDKLNNDWLLEFRHPILDSITVFAQDETTTWKKTQLGAFFEFSQRYLEYRNPTYLLNLPFEQSKIIYIRVRSGGSYQIPMFISHERTFFADRLAGEVTYGLFFGMLLALIFYNLFLFFSLREITYLYYVISLITSTLLFAFLSGHLFQYLLPCHPTFTEKLGSICVGISLIVTNLFTREFLNIKSFSKYLHNLFSFLIAFGFISLVLMPLTPRMYLNIIYDLAILASLILIFISSYWAWYSGNNFARFFSLAWAIFVLGAMVMVFRNTGIFPNNFFTSHSVEIGLIIQAILLSIAIRDKRSA